MRLDETPSTSGTCRDLEAVRLRSADVARAALAEAEVLRRRDHSRAERLEHLRDELLGLPARELEVNSTTTSSSGPIASISSMRRSKVEIRLHLVAEHRARVRVNVTTVERSPRRSAASIAAR